MRMAIWLCGKFQKYLICFNACSRSRSSLKAVPNSLHITGNREMETRADITSASQRAALNLSSAEHSDTDTILLFIALSADFMYETICGALMSSTVVMGLAIVPLPADLDAYQNFEEKIIPAVVS